jgi:O-glycosyl hydrolase
VRRPVAAVAAVAAAFAGALVTAAPPAARAAASPQVISVNGTSSGRVFDGVGALSAGASSRLLADYPEPERSQILDYLFRPDYGASLQILKVEIGGDTNSTDGTEPSVEPEPGQVDCDAGYEWWLMEQAKARNPGIRLYALEWGAPGWVGAGTGTVWTSQNISYLLTWLGCARQHGLQINYLGGWNEKGYNEAWYEDLRAALDANGYGNVQIVAADSFGWSVASAMAADTAFDAAVSDVGVHYPCGYLGAYENCPSTATAEGLGKPLWASEQGSQPYDSGAAPLARAINRAYIDGQMTASINWSLVWSAYGGLPFGGDGLMLANTPWSGNYTLGQSIWVMAHTTQFTQPGWRYLDSGSTRLGGGGSVVTLRSPSSGDWSSIAETTDATAAQQVTYQVTGGLSTGPVHVWATNMKSGDPAQWFQYAGDVQPAGGSFTLTLQPGYLYTLTTTAGQHKGTAAAPPPAPLPLPYVANFGAYPPGVLPRYVAPLGGTFQTAPCISAVGAYPGRMCLAQVVTQQPVQWNAIDNHPIAVVGDPSAWQNYDVTADALLEQPGYAALVGRALGPANGLTGYHFRVSSAGQWSLYSQDASGDDVTLASGTAAFATGVWHRLGLDLRGDEITAFLDGRPLATVVDDAYQFGQVGLETSAWTPAQFGNLRVLPVPVAGKAPVIGAVRVDPAEIPAAGGSARLSATVTDPGLVPATDVTARVHVTPAVTSVGATAGWTATPVQAPPGLLRGGQAAPVSWTLAAPAGAPPGLYDATIEVTYTSGGLTWVAGASAPVYVAVVPQDEMTATATSSQPGYPPAYAIDGNPGTLWSTEFSPVFVHPPQSITLDLGGSYDVHGLLYLPRQTGNLNGVITGYEVFVSTDGTTFTPVGSGTWALSRVLKSATFPAVSGVRYVRLEAVTAYDNTVTAAEIDVLGTLAAGQQPAPAHPVPVQNGRLTPIPGGLSEQPGQDGQVRYGQAILSWWHDRGPDRPAGRPLPLIARPGSANSAGS